MGLRDTIEGARREAQEAGGVFSGKQEEEKKPEQAEESKGFSKRSAARAKPSTAAASSVRIVSAEDARRGKSGKARSEMTKEERKAERSSMRDAEDRANTVVNILLGRNEEYSRVQRVWWILLGAGLAMTLVSFAINRQLNAQTGQTPDATLATISLVLIALAYASIIAAFIYDMVKARPIRRNIADEVAGMNKRRQEQIIREDEQAKAEKQAQKAAKKASKSADKNDDGEGK